MKTKEQLESEIQELLLKIKENEKEMLEHQRKFQARCNFLRKEQYVKHTTSTPSTKFKAGDSVIDMQGNKAKISSIGYNSISNVNQYEIMWDNGDITYAFTQDVDIYFLLEEKNKQKYAVVKFVCGKRLNR